MPASKFTPEIHAAVVRALSKGITRQGAADICGITDRTLRLWCDKGRKGEEPYVQFAADVAKAEGEIEVDMTGVVITAAKDGDWRAAQLWLERRRAAWRPQTRVEADHRVANVTLDDLDQMRDAAASNECDPSNENEPNS